MKCICKNCKFVITPYINNKQHTYNNNVRKYKSGIILHNPTTNHILIVQSRGNMWGFPKGSMEHGETFKECAIREFREETGIIIDVELLSSSIDYRLNHFVNYYYIKTQEDYADIQVSQHEKNDANSICWVKLDCLRELLVNDKIKLNYQARCCLYHYFKISRNNI